MRLRARWNGPLPAVGDYLRSEKRPRYAYLIKAGRMVDLVAAEVLSLVSGVTPVVDATLSLEVERVEVANVPSDAKVHPWRWDPRGLRKPRSPWPGSRGS